MKSNTWHRDIESCVAVGMGVSRQPGKIGLCDETEDAGRGLARILRDDPAPGVVRDADAGWGAVIGGARKTGPNLSMPGAGRG